MLEPCNSFCEPSAPPYELIHQNCEPSTQQELSHYILAPPTYNDLVKEKTCIENFFCCFYSQ